MASLLPLKSPNSGVLLFEDAGDVEVILHPLDVAQVADLFDERELGAVGFPGVLRGGDFMHARGEPVRKTGDLVDPGLNGGVHRRQFIRAA
jgi:hypothetical protein